MDKTCTKCQTTKSESEFYFNKGKRITRCNKCVNASNQRWRKANPERRKQTDRIWVDNNRDRVKAAQERWKAKNPELAKERAKIWYYENKSRHLEYNRKSDKKTRDLVFGAYGGYRCECCGETIREFLTIDHINNDGANHRREVFGKKVAGRKFYQWLVKNDFPKGFQVLCMNCNWGKARNPDHVCPHKLSILEPSTTIPKGSRPQVNNGGRSAWPLEIEGEEIVSSAWRHAAVFQ